MINLDVSNLKHGLLKFVGYWSYNLEQSNILKARVSLVYPSTAPLEYTSVMEERSGSNSLALISSLPMNLKGRK